VIRYKILFISRSSLFKVKGGDTVQIINTALKLRELGLIVDLKLSDDLNINYGNYNLIHFFNIIRPADILFHIRKSILPFVISTIYVDYSEYEKREYLNTSNRFLSLFDSNFREYLKVIARSLLNGEKIVSKKYLVFGHKKSIKIIIKRASFLLPNSENEYRRLRLDYEINNKYIVVPNAADSNIFNLKNECKVDRNPKIVLCVGRIEGRKNQLNLIKALRNTEFILYIIGKPAPNHLNYFQKCKEEASDNIFFIDELSQNELADYYLKAKVHILPSLFETTGLSSLEALFCGCNIVVTEYGDTKDYFPSSEVFYCNPDSIQSIYDNVRLASLHQSNIQFIDEMKERYSWLKAAQITMNVYKQVIELK